MFLPANITLKFGDSGDFVSELQRRLATVHCFSADQVNGFFDGATVNGVSAFQSMNGLRADGIAGPETLRRLNGVISGDTSSSTNNAEEEQRKRQEEAARILAQQEAFARQQQMEQERLAAEQATAPAQQEWHHNQAPQQPEIQYTQEAAYTPQQAQPEIQQQQRTTEAAQQQLHVQQQQQLMQSQLMQAHEPQHQQYAQSVPAHHMPPQQPPQQQIHGAPAPHQPTPVQIVSMQQPAPLQPQVASLATQAPTHHATAPAPQAIEPAAAPRGLVGRAMQYANEMVQKLSNYFESKLSPDHLAAAKEAGIMLAKSGVREAAIPTGPEPQRGIDGPARGQQQVQQRG